MKGLTRQPCHGCGTQELHHAGSLCARCRKKIADADRIESAGAEYLASLGSVDLPTRPYDLPHLAGDRDPDYPLRSAIMGLMWAATYRPDVPRPPFRGWRLLSGPLASNFHPSEDRAGVATEAIVEAFTTLYRAISTAMDRARAEGFDDGSYLLRRLAEGAVSEADFSERRTRNRAVMLAEGSGR